MIESHIAAGAIYALGNFDGVHRGHHALLAAAKQIAEPAGVPVLAFSFAPHPRRFFAPELPPFLLTNDAQKTELLQAAGADAVVTMPFTASFFAMSPMAFAHDVLRDHCRAGGVVAGEDFRFGYQRGGDMARLAAWLPQMPVLPLPPVRDEQGQRYASSTVRALLQTGQTAAAAAILGRPWAIRGTVTHGEARGRQLGFPTANFALGDYVQPRFGVYVVQGRRVADGLTVAGVANIGNRPTVDGVTPRLEVHFFDFQADIYAQEWDILLLDFIRPEQKFADLAALSHAIAEDCSAARTILLRFYTTSN